MDLTLLDKKGTIMHYLLRNTSFKALRTIAKGKEEEGVGRGGGTNRQTMG
jgi:hypothetical protein